MAQSDIAGELFLPLENGDWRADRFRILPGEKAQARTRVTGVRFLAADPARENLEPERAVQNDFHRLITSLITVRSTPEGRGLELSGECFRTSRRGETPRTRFGLRRHAEDRLPTEAKTAARTHAAVRRSIRRAGFVVEAPTTRFDPATGLIGLRAWTDQLRLRKRRRWWPWLLLLPLLLLIPRCEPSAQFFGAPIETNSFVLLIDRSGSMASHFAALQAEGKRVLNQLAAHGGCAADIIVYDSAGESCLGQITALDEATVARLSAFLDNLGSGGGTNLQSGMALAAQEIAAWGEPTTIIILTDAEDSSIPAMIADRDGLLAGFGDVRIHTYGLTPQWFAPANPAPPDPATSNPAPPPPGGAGGAATTTPAQPQNESERRLGELAEILGGRFGPTLSGSDTK